MPASNCTHAHTLMIQSQGTVAWRWHWACSSFLHSCPPTTLSQGGVNREQVGVAQDWAQEICLSGISPWPRGFAAFLPSFRPKIDRKRTGGSAHVTTPHFGITTCGTVTSLHLVTQSRVSGRIACRLQRYKHFLGTTVALLRSYTLAPVQLGFVTI